MIRVAAPFITIAQESGDALKPIVEKGRNCWQIAQADSLRVLVDGENYFAAIREALLAARRQVWILGWDLNSKLQLVRPAPDDGAPNELKALLEYVLEQNEELEVYMLAWDYSWIYASEREFLPTDMRKWKCHPRLHFAMDSHHPVGGSQHQKIVIVDNSLAFAGGFDLTSHRWDRRSHPPLDPLRRNADGTRYAPFHDVQMAVSGEAAQALGEVCLQRWQEATNEKPIMVSGPEPVWLRVEPEMQRVPVAISRTLPVYGERKAITEIEQLHLDSIAKAQRYIYIENQYFTSESIAQALIHSLSQEQGPEVVLVISESSSGWLEEMTMDVLRSRWFERLREADRHHRFQIYHPLSGKTKITVHGKLMIVDDRLLRIGSANLSNRSMSIDSECDLTVDASLSPENCKAIRNQVLSLLSEHLDTPLATLDNYWGPEVSLMATIDYFRGHSRTLIPHEEELPLWIDELVDLSVSHEAEKPRRSSWLIRHLAALPKTRWKVLACLGILALVVMAWLVTPLKGVLGIKQVIFLLSQLSGVANYPALVVALYAVLSFFVMPLWVMLLLTYFTLKNADAFMISLIGSLFAATLNYWAARFFGRRLLRGYLGYDLKLLSRKMGSQGVLGLIWLRFLPGSSFTLLNLVAGASVVRFPKFLFSTLLGLAPVIYAFGFVKEGVQIWIESTSAPFEIGALGVVLLGYALYRLKQGSLRFRPEWLQHSLGS